MVFGKGRITSDIAITINQNIIERVCETNFLDIIIEDKLSWKAHILSVKSKLAKTMSIIYKTTFFLKASALITLYSLLFFSYIDYCSEIWGNTYRTNLMLLLTLQKRVVRIICGTNACGHSNILFINLTFIKFFDLIEYKTSILMYKLKCKLLPNNIQRFFYSNEDSLHNMAKIKKISSHCTKG